MASDLDLLARDAARKLRPRLLAQLGLATPLALSLACSAPPTDDNGDGGVTTDPSSGGSSEDPSGEAEVDGSMTTLVDDEAEAEAEAEAEDGMEKFDVGGDKLDVPVPEIDCESRWLDPVMAEAEYPDCDVAGLDPNIYYEIMEVCVDLPEGVGSCAEICTGPNCEGMDPCIDSWFWEGPVLACGFYDSPTGCCSVFAGEPPPPVGRPFVVDGQARLAAAEPLDERVAGHWLDVARGEHASIAAFARFIADLQRFAAPPRLLRAALAAAGDEVEHTRLALELASRFAGRELELGALDVSGAVDVDAIDLRAAVRAAVIEGCVGETLAAHEATCLAAVAQDPEVALALVTIADDEARHAALAWGFVGWALERDPSLRPLVAEILSDALAKAPSAAFGGPAQPGALALGCPPPELRARWRELGLRELVKPCARHLLGTVGVGYQSLS